MNIMAVQFNTRIFMRAVSSSNCCLIGANFSFSLCLTIAMTINKVIIVPLTYSQNLSFICTSSICASLLIFYTSCWFKSSMDAAGLIWKSWLSSTPELIPPDKLLHLDIFERSTISTAKLWCMSAVARRLKYLLFVIVADQYYKRSLRMLSTKYRFDTSCAYQTVSPSLNLKYKLSAKAAYPELHPEANSAIICISFPPIKCRTDVGITIYSTTHL